LLTALARNVSAPQINSKIIRVLNEPVGHFDRFDPGHGQAERQAEAGSQHFVRQHSDVLGVVLEFCDIPGTVGCPKKVRLRSAAQFTQVLDGRDARGHGAPPLL
jgi:hypothetical protein